MASNNEPSTTEPQNAASSPTEQAQKGYVVGQSITSKFKYEPIQTLTPMEMAQADFYQNCVFRSVAAGVAGGVMGVAFGIFMGAMEPASLSTPSPLGDQPSKSAWQVFKGMVRSTSQRSSYDSYSCDLTGSVLTGPTGMVMGAATFAGFSVVIDQYMGLH